MTDRSHLYLGIGTSIIGPLCIIALFLGRNEYPVTGGDKYLVYALMLLVCGFIFIFGYIPLSLYKDERRGTK